MPLVIVAVVFVDLRATLVLLVRLLLLGQQCRLLAASNAVTNRPKDIDWLDESGWLAETNSQCTSAATAAASSSSNLGCYLVAASAYHRCLWLLLLLLLLLVLLLVLVLLLHTQIEQFQSTTPTSCWKVAKLLPLSLAFSAERKKHLIEKRTSQAKSNNSRPLGNIKYGHKSW